jgi:hypothetical protein
MMDWLGRGLSQIAEKQNSSHSSPRALGDVAAAPILHYVPNALYVRNRTTRHISHRGLPDEIVSLALSRAVAREASEPLYSAHA